MGISRPSEGEQSEVPGGADGTTRVTSFIGGAVALFAR